MNQQPNIHQKINYRMAQRVLGYIITKHPYLRKTLPTYLKTRARYNTCYDLAAPIIPTAEVNKYLSKGSDKVKTYIKNNISRNKYLRVEVTGTPVGVRYTHSLIKELPMDYQELERTGAIRFVDVREVKI